MNTLDFLYFILDKHHEGKDPEDDSSFDYTGKYEDTEPITDGCELASNIDK
jgi:hypothetical protein